MSCVHKDFIAEIEIRPYQGRDRCLVAMRITCKHCHMPFRFLGLPIVQGVEGAFVSPDGKEGFFTIAEAKSDDPSTSFFQVSH